MALFKDSQSSDARINSFYDLPDMQWHGTTLYDKKTFDVISGYDPINIPIINNSKIHPATNVVIDAYTSSPQIDFNLSFKGRTPIPNNFILTQHAYMNSNLYPHQYIPDTNIINDIPKAYTIDPDDPDIIYFIAATSFCNFEVSLVKFNYKLQEMVWIEKLITHRINNNVGNVNDDYISNAAKYKIWNIKNKKLYVIAENLTALGASNNIYNSIANCFMVISTENGKIIKNATYEPINESIDANRDPYIWHIYNGVPTFLCSNSLIYIKDLNDEEALFFTNLICFTNNSNTSSTTSENATVNLNENNRMIYKASYFKYNYNSHKTELYKGRSISEIKNKALMNYSFSVRSSAGSYVHIAKVSQKDRTINDKAVVYSCWGELFNIYYRQDNDSDFRNIYKFEFDYNTNTQNSTKMKVINSDGTDFTLKNWRINKNKNGYANYSQPYIIYGKDDKKYLMIFENYSSTFPVKQDMLMFTHLFKFIDSNTLQLVDQIPLAVTDLFFAKDDIFIGLRDDRIRFYKIDYDNDKFDNFKSIQPEKIGNKFLFASIDDMGNFWYSEGISTTHNRDIQNNMRLNYINSYTVNRIELVKEKEKFEYNNQEINSFINVSVISDYDDIIERDIEITILGNAKFKENSTKYLKTKSVSGASKKIEFVITGTGEIIFNANLTKE